MTEPPSSVGVVQLSEMESAVLDVVEIVGADGAVIAWVVIVWLAEKGPVPAEFMAAIL